MSPSSCLAILLLASAALLVQASIYETEDVGNDCASWCTCSYGLSSRSVSYCCPSGIPDPDLCTGNTHTCSGETCEGRTVIQVPSTRTVIQRPTRVVQKCRYCSRSTADFRQRWCSTKLATLIGCRSSHYVNRCATSRGCYSGGVVQHGCVQSGGCTSETECTSAGGCVPCCSQSPTEPNIYQPFGRPNLQEAILAAAQRSYTSRESFVFKIKQILHSQNSYSWTEETSNYGPDIYEMGTPQVNIYTLKPPLPVKSHEEDVEYVSSED